MPQDHGIALILQMRRLNLNEIKGLAQITQPGSGNLSDSKLWLLLLGRMVLVPTSTVKDNELSWAIISRKSWCFGKNPREAYSILLGNLF